MSVPLLATTLRVPPQTRHLVPRARLLEALERGICETGAKLILVSAPAGYGKTTLLTQWAYASRARVAWLSLSEEENEPERFFRSLLAAWEEVQPDIRESPLGLLLSSRQPDLRAVLAAFINVASQLPAHTVFVLDDAHLIDEPTIHEAMAFLLDHLPPMLHFVLAGRGDPPLPLARLRARRELLEVRAADLQFRVEEAGEFLNELMQLDLGADEISSLQTQLEGWAAGLHLASLTLRRRAGEPIVVSGRHRFIADYLADEVLAYLPEGVQRFLLQTCLLDRLCGSLCDAVTESAVGQETLELLEQENLFLVPLDDNREWFRYHRLFADVLRAELQRRHPDEVADLHRRAASWYFDHDLPDDAFRHALAGNDPILLSQVAARYVLSKLFRGEIRLVRRWLTSIPDPWYVQQPELGLCRAAMLFFAGQFDDCARALDEVERLALAAGTENLAPVAKLTAVRCLMACHQNDLARAEILAREALRDLPEDDLQFRPGVFGSLGDAYRLNGRWEEAKACYAKMLTFTHLPMVHIESVHVYGALADLDLRQGRLRDAAAHWQRALAVIQDQETQGSYSLPVIGWVYLRIGELLYERNDLAGAWDHICRGLERAELGGEARALIAGYDLASRLKLTQGDVAAAEEYLERARPLLSPGAYPDWSGRFARCQIELWLAQNRLRAALDWADSLQRDELGEEQPEREASRLALARVLITKGDHPALQQASSILDRLLSVAQREGRAGVQIEALALRAMALWQSGDRAGAMTSLQRALQLAEPEGYVRLFADLGLPMIRLLQEALARQVMPEYVERLLSACSVGGALPGPSNDPLSQREQEILRHLAAGLTNREIAESLSISPETVKKHAATIYGKLGVGNRTEAAARARELDLLT